jgi:MraZ protein
MFWGHHEISLDAKGRMAIPAAYRELLLDHGNGKLIVTVDLRDPCLRLYPLPVWDDLATQLEKLPNTNPAVRNVQRRILGYASDMEMDNNGRVLLPPALRKYASLEKGLVLMGMGKKFELWSETKWKDCQREMDAGMETLPEEIASISF